MARRMLVRLPLVSLLFFMVVLGGAGCGGGSKGGAVTLDLAEGTDGDASGAADVALDLGDDEAAPPCPDPDLDSDDDGTPDCLDEDDDDDGFPDDLDCEPLDPTVSYGALEVCDGQDQNCNGLVDEGFPDTDLDGDMDCVDDDDDDDLIPDWDDNCPVDENLEQEDVDGDGAGDPCDPDDDDDDVDDDVDNCPLTPNTLQTDSDEDGFGDACDVCPELADAGVDTDGDGIGDACDAFPYDGTEAFDHDFDGIGDNEDGDNFDFGVLSYSYDLADAGVGEDLGVAGDLWPAARHDRAGTGASLGVGDLTTPVAASRMFLGGLVDPHAVDLVDVNGDGKEEVVMVSGGRVVAFRPDGSLLWSTPVLGAGAQFLRGAADLDGNGTTELVVMRDAKPGAFWVLRGSTGNVAFAEEDWAGDPVVNGSIQLAGALHEDINGDGLWDLAVVGSYPGVLVRIRVVSFASGIDAPQVIHHWETDASMVGQTMVIGDVDGDAVQDLVLQNGYGTVEVLPLDGEEISVAASAPTDWLASIVALRDVDGDGDDEIFSLRTAVPSKVSSIRVLDWQGGGLVELWSDFTDNATDLRVAYPWADALADMDGDGHLDLVLSVLVGDADWVLEIRDAATGEELSTRSGLVPVEIVGALGAGPPILISVTGSDDPYGFGGDVEAVRMVDGSIETIWSLPMTQPAWGSRVRYPVGDTSGCNYGGANCGLVHMEEAGVIWGLFLRDDDGDGLPETLIKVDLADGDILATQPLFNPAGIPGVIWRVPRAVKVGSLVRIIQLSTLGIARVLDGDLNFKNNPYLLGSLGGAAASLAGPGKGTPILHQGTAMGRMLRLAHDVDTATPFPLPLGEIADPLAGALLGLLDPDGSGIELPVIGRRVDAETVIVEVFNTNGDAPLWQWTVPPGKTIARTLFARVDAVPGEEVVFHLNDAVGTDGNAFMVLSGEDGSELWSAEGQIPFAGSRPTRGLDLDGDGRDELVSGAHGSSLSFFSSVDGALLWDSDESLGFDTQNVSAITGAELAAGGAGIVVTSSSRVLGLQVTGTDPWEVGLLWYRDAIAPTAPVLLDLDDDGWDDVVYWTGSDGLVALDGETGVPLWVRRYKGGDQLPSESPLVGPPLATPVAGDVDGDGVSELLVASSDGFLYCMAPDAGGALKWTIFFGVRLFSPILADLDGLGHLEIFQQTGDGFLYMLDQIGL
ncbi:MAG: FG-GAP-like repeat-containing protein [Pseudomonadota bacterium]